MKVNKILLELVICMICFLLMIGTCILKNLVLIYIGKIEKLRR